MAGVAGVIEMHGDPAHAPKAAASAWSATGWGSDPAPVEYAGPAAVEKGLGRRGLRAFPSIVIACGPEAAKDPKDGEPGLEPVQLAQALARQASRGDGPGRPRLIDHVVQSS